MTQNGNGNEFVDYISLDGIVDNVDEQAWDGTGSDPVPPGEYKFEVMDVKQGKSPRKNTPQLELTLEIVEGDLKGRRTWARYYLTDKAVGRLLNVMKACGVGLDDRKGFSLQAMIGARIIATVTHEAYQDGINPVTQAPIMKTSTKITGEKAIEVPKAPAPRGAQAARGVPVTQNQARR